MSSGFIMFALACSQAFLPVDRAAEQKRAERRIFEDKRFGIVVEPAGMERPLDVAAATTLVQRCRSVGALYLTVRGGAALDEDVRAALESSCRKGGVTFQVRDEAAYGRRPGEPGTRRQTAGAAHADDRGRDHAAERVFEYGKDGEKPRGKSAAERSPKSDLLPGRRNVVTSDLTSVHQFALQLRDHTLSPFLFPINFTVEYNFACILIVSSFFHIVNTFRSNF